MFEITFLKVSLLKLCYECSLYLAKKGGVGREGKPAKEKIIEYVEHQEADRTKSTVIRTRLKGRKQK